MNYTTHTHAHIYGFSGVIQISVSSVFVQKVMFTTNEIISYKSRKKSCIEYIHSTMGHMDNLADRYSKFQIWILLRLDMQNKSLKCGGFF